MLTNTQKNYGISLLQILEVNIARNIYLLFWLANDSLQIFFISISDFQSATTAADEFWGARCRRNNQITDSERVGNDSTLDKTVLDWHFIIQI